MTNYITHNAVQKLKLQMMSSFVYPFLIRLCYASWDCSSFPHLKG